MAECVGWGDRELAAQVTYLNLAATNYTPGNVFPVRPVRQQILIRRTERKHGGFELVVESIHACAIQLDSHDA